MIYPLVRDLAADEIPIAVTCRVLGFTKQAYFKWRANPVTARDWNDAHLINAARDIHHEDTNRPGVRLPLHRRRTRTAGRYSLTQPRQPLVQPAEAVVGPRPQARRWTPARSSRARRPGPAEVHR